jgi:anti-sigma factor RsiW
MRHWTEDQYIGRLYGLGGGDEAHLETCPRCRHRWQELAAHRKRITSDPEIPADLLAAQRRSIYRRLDRQPAPLLKWVPVAGAMLALVVGLVMFRPGSQPAAPLSAPGDEAVFAEVYSLEQNAAPLAAKPIEALFEDN